jgi:hypothetical protein
LIFAEIFVGETMKLTKDIIEVAIDAYATRRHPARWDGEPWGDAGRRNHRAAIKAALVAAFKQQKLHTTATICKPSKDGH